MVAVTACLMTRRFPPPWTACYFSILIVRVVVAPHFLQAYVKSHRSVSSETATGGDGVIGRLQPGQVTVAASDRPGLSGNRIRLTISSDFQTSEAAVELDQGRFS